MSWTWPDGYDPVGDDCADGPQPGLVALEGWLEDNRGRGRSGGIYNCRNVGGTTTLSVHGEGRALDWMVPTIADGDQVLDLLATRGRDLGIQFIIFNRRKYGPRYPSGAPYSGQSPHTDHLHIEMTWAAARALNRTAVDQILGDDMIRRGDHNDDVRELQQRLNVCGASLAVDGIYGPLTSRAVAGFMAATRIDGDPEVVGIVTFAKIERIVHEIRRHGRTPPLA